MKIREELEKLNKMSDAELKAELDKVYHDARISRLEIEARKSTNSAKVFKQRKHIARILTILNARSGE